MLKRGFESRQLSTQTTVESGARASWDCGENPRSRCGVDKVPLILNALRIIDV